MGIHVYEGEDVGSCVGRGVEGRRKRRIDRLTDAQISVDDDAGRVSAWPFEVALPRSSAFYGGPGRVWRACCRNGGVELVGFRNASPRDDLLRGIVVGVGQIYEAGIPVRESDMSARDPSQRGKYSAYNITEENVMQSMAGSGKSIVAA